MKREMDCYQGLKLTHILFFGGLGLMFLSVLIGAAVNVELVMVVLGVVGFIAAIGGLFCGLIYVRCPGCNGSLMAGGRVPGGLPKFCPHCGNEL